MLKNNILYSLKDICIIPAIMSNIDSRKECYPLCNSIEGNPLYLPLIASPMDSVVDDLNYRCYWENNISCIIPRTVPIEKRVNLCNGVFCAFSLDEIKEWFLDSTIGYNNFYVLIDIANGHMSKEISIGAKLIKKYGNKLHLMGGNIANPETYKVYNAIGFDFVRIGIGGGDACLTSTNTGIHYPYASLINDTVESKKKQLSSKCKIIVDGGMSSYSDIIKALALGADYVMCGKIFAKAAKTEKELGQECIYRGMSTVEVQKAMGNKTFKATEGRSTKIIKEYLLSDWVNNFSSYIRSAMSYCNSKTLSEFREKAICSVVSASTNFQINNK